MTIIEQLAKLAEVAPDVCTYQREFYHVGSYIFSNPPDSEILLAWVKGKTTVVEGRPALAWLQDALEQAIEVRGWYFELRYQSVEKRYMAEVNNRYVYASVLAEALLGALIKAVK